MDKFLLAENPMRPDDSGIWVIHLLNPQAHIECIEGHVKTDKTHKHYQFKNADGVIEDWTLSAQFFFTTDFVSEPDAQVIPLLDRAWRWFRSYLEFEDKNIDTDERN